MDKMKALEKIAQEISVCKICKRGSLGLPVAGEGNPDAKIAFIGEAPGKTEAATGRPFVGRSGKLLRSSIQELGLDDLKGVFITSPVKYLPKAGTPDKKQIAHGMTHLQKQLNVINPEIIVLLGATATYGILEERLPVAKMHGQKLNRGGRQYFISYHPAAALRFPKLRKVFLSDFRKLKKLV
jgi:uracil-DNA glycosylase